MKYAEAIARHFFHIKKFDDTLLGAHQTIYFSVFSCQETEA